MEGSVSTLEGVKVRDVVWYRPERARAVAERDGKPPPHLYLGGDLCLYLPGSGEWYPDKPVAATILPWASLWLYYYEIWLATGEWLGGGVHPVDSKDKKALSE